MSIVLVLLGLVSLFLAFVHIVFGGRECARPLLDATIDPIAKLTLYATWHFVTAHLVLGGLALLWFGVFPTPAGTAVAAVLATTYLVLAGLFIALAARCTVPGAWHKLGQWMVFLPMGVAGLWAVLS